MNKNQEKHEALLSAALALQEAGENDQAIEILKDIIRIKPDYVPAHISLGVAYQSEDENALAEKAFRKALEFDAINPEGLKGFGFFLVSQKRYAEALPYLQKHFKLHPDDSGSLNGVLDALKNLPDRKNEIKDTLRHAWEHTRNPDIGLRFGRYLLINDETTTARQVFAEVVDISKTSKTLSELAIACLINNDCDSAVKLLNEAIEIDSSCDSCYRELVLCYKEKKEFEKALEAAESAIATNPKNYRNWQSKTSVLLNQRQFEKALESSQKGIELLIENQEELTRLRPTTSNLYFQRMIALFNLDMIEDALELATNARVLMPKNLHFYLYPALRLSKLNRDDEALEIIDSSTDKNISFLLEPMRYRLLHQLDRANEAWDFIKPSLEKDTEMKINSLASMGVSIYKSGLREIAISIYKQLSSFQPDNLRLKINLGYMLIGEKEFAESEKILLDASSVTNEDIYTLIGRCNLAYLYNLTGKYKKALEIVENILQDELSKEEAILRIPFWVNKKMIDDPSRFPGRETLIGTAAKGCGAAAAMAMGKITKAEKFIHGLHDENSKDPLHKMVSGCVELEKGNRSTAREHWDQALQLSENENDKQAIQQWLKDSMPSG